MRNRVRAARWQTAGTQAVVSHNGPLTPEQQVWVSVINGRGGAALAGLTATALHGLAGYPSPELHVLVRQGVRVLPQPGIVVHQTRHLDESDVQPAREPRRTRLSRSLIDAARWARDDERACAILLAAVQQRLIPPARLALAVTSAPRVPRRGLLLSVLGDAAGGAHALGEVNATRLCRRAGLPAPDQQAVRRDRQGRRRYLDLLWKRWRLAAEIDGAAHMQLTQWWGDMDRHNDLALGKEHLRLLRFPSMLLHLQPEVFTTTVRRGLILGGWRDRGLDRA